MAEEIPPGSVYITPKQMWEATQESLSLARENAQKLDELKLMVDPVLHDLRADLNALEIRHDKDHTEHAIEIEALKKQAWSSKWVPALVSFVLSSTVVAIVVMLVTRSLTNITVQ